MSTVALITVYHFNAQSHAYTRLVRGVSNLMKQLCKGDKLILVANGISDGAGDPDDVLREVDPDHPDRVEPVVMWRNAQAAGGLNVGMQAALRCGQEWIGQVQSSVVVKGRWLKAMRTKSSNGGLCGIAGRLVCEEQPDTIWSDGHRLSEGRTWDLGYGKPRDWSHDAEGSLDVPVPERRALLPQHRRGCHRRIRRLRDGAPHALR